MAAAVALRSASGGISPLRAALSRAALNGAACHRWSLLSTLGNLWITFCGVDDERVAIRPVPVDRGSCHA